MFISLKLPQDEWRKPLLTDQKGLREQHDRGRLHGQFVNGVLQAPGGPPLPTRADQATSSSRTDSLGIEVVINGERWVELGGRWLKERKRISPSGHVIQETPLG